MDFVQQFYTSLSYLRVKITVLYTPSQAKTILCIKKYFFSSLYSEFISKSHN